MSSICETIARAIGRTPLVRLGRLDAELDVELYGKPESKNPGGSVKDRICAAMIEDAEARGILVRPGPVVEPTSGNTGIGLALVCAVKGYRLILTMPESMSLERRQLLQAYGAEIVLTPAEAQMEGAIAKAREIAGGTPGAFMPQQFENAANPSVHARTTAFEIVQAMHGLTARLARGFGLTGIFSPEFVVHADTGEPILLELNRRMSHGSHIGTAFNVDIAAALYSAMHGLSPTTRAELDDGEEHRCAHFPSEWIRDAGSRWLLEARVDIPWDEPELFQAMVEEGRRQLQG